MNKNKQNWTEFSFPIKYKSISFDFPFTNYGGIKKWFFDTWESPNSNDKSIWIGTRFLGVKVLRVIWTCSEKEARKQHKEGYNRLFKWVNGLVKESNKNLKVVDKI